MKRGNKSGAGGLVRWAVRPLAVALASAIVGRDGATTRSQLIDRAILALSTGDPDLSHPLGRTTAMIAALEIVADMAQKDALVLRLLHSGAILRVGFVNAHAVNLVWRDPDVARAFLSLDVLLRDGSGLKMLLKNLDRDPGLNMNGTDFIPEVLAAGKGQPVCLYGTQDPWLSRAADRLRADGHDIVDTCDGFKKPEDYANRFATAPARIVLLAMGMPKQERVAQILKPGGADEAVLILCGGAIVDFLSQRHRRAPEWMRQYNIEWVFRLVSEPVRLFRRYVFGNATFLLRTAFLPGRRAAHLAERFLRFAQLD